MAAALFREIKALRQAAADAEHQKRYELSLCSELGEDATLVIQEDPAGGVGGSIWDAALQLYRSVEATGKRGHLRGKRVVDLGSGTGILGLLAACYGAAEVQLTDRQEVLELLRLNVKLNSELLERTGSVVLCTELEWNSGQEAALNPPFDIILASECIYNMRYAPALLSTINALQGPKTTVLFTFASRNPDEEHRWFEEEVKKTWTITELAVPQPPQKPGDQVPPSVHLQIWQSSECQEDPKIYAQDGIPSI